MGNRRRRKKYPKRYCTIDFYECIGLTNEGKGIINYNNKPFYVDELLPYEYAQILVYYEEDSYGIARAIKIKNSSPNRKLPLGHWKFSLGSYHLSHMTDKAQDDFKQNKVNNLFPQAKKIIIGKRSYYRNKVSLTNGGFMPPGRGRKHSIIPQKFDLMELDFSKYKDKKGVWIVRRLKTEIEGKPGTKIYAMDDILGKKFYVSLDSFYQVNTEMAKKAYKKIRSFIKKDEIVFDLFSGIGTIGIIISDIAKKIYCVEINKNCHQDAINNVKLNNLKNVQVINKDANQFIVDNKNQADIIIIDPARAGISNLAAQTINNSGVNKIIYLSCNIYTQKRDINLMDNYEIVYVQPYDFFPQTFHIENLVVLNKKSISKI